jgi:hypothetical protein
MGMEWNSWTAVADFSRNHARRRHGFQGRSRFLLVGRLTQPAQPQVPWQYLGVGRNALDPTSGYWSRCAGVTRWPSIPSAMQS